MNHAGANIPVKIHCTANFGNIPCNTEGMTVYVDPREIPQNGDVAGQDDHLAIIDPAAGYEYDFWKVQWPPVDGVLTAAWSGRCALAGNGFTNPAYKGPAWNASCASSAAATPMSMGLIRAKDLLAAIADPVHGSLPQAIAFGITCPGKGVPLPAPFKGSGDGECPGHPPEGSHLYIALHDADVDDLALPPIVAVIVRTLDEDHFGAFITDTGGAQPGMQMYALSDSTYAVWGLPPPWLTTFIPEASRERLPGSIAPCSGCGQYQIPIVVPTEVTAAVRFL